MTPILYTPKRYYCPLRLVDVPSAWQGCAIILADILDRFRVKRETCLEFGVEHGYSTAALSNFFQRVVAVDWFGGDTLYGYCDPVEREASTRATLSKFPNVQVVAQKFEDFAPTCDQQCDFCHIDIEHTYETTLACGLWAVEHAPVVIFHDTKSYPAVLKAITEISNLTGMYCYDWPEPDGCCGLGILSREAL